MPKTRPDERLVYLALRHGLAAGNTQLKAKKIKEKLQKLEHNLEVRALVQEHNADNISNVAKALPDEGVFHSTLRAKLRFPEVFDVSPAQSAERSASEVEAARHEADAFEIAVRGSKSIVIDQPATIATATPKSSKFTLYPVYLPMHVQVRLMARTQSDLENICFDFAKQQMPDVLKSRGWTCSESVELSEWSKILSARKDKFTEEALAEARPSAEFWSSIAEIRHTAVHRLRITAGRVEQLLRSAESLCRLLDRHDVLEQMSHLRHTMLLVIEEMKRNKDLLENRMQDKLRDLTRQKKNLERQEKDIVRGLLEGDDKYEQQFGENLEEMLGLGQPNLASSKAESAFESALDEQEHTCGQADTTSPLKETDSLAVKYLDDH